MLSDHEAVIYDYLQHVVFVNSYCLMTGIILRTACIQWGIVSPGNMLASVNQHKDLLTHVKYQKAPADQR